MSFRSLAREPGAENFLRTVIQKNHLPHALLFTGTEKSGMRDAALELTASLFCRTGKPKAGPCGECSPCGRVQRLAHPDLRILEPEENSRAIKIEAVRTLIGQAALKPFEAARQVFIIDRAECLNDVSQNALLKTLEEPEGNSVFILITSNPDALMATVRSRLQTVSFVSLDSSPHYGEEEERLRGEALEFIRQGRQAMPPDFSKADRQVAARVLDGLVGFFRDALVLRAGAIELADKKDAGFTFKEEFARQFDEEELGRRIELLGEAKERILANLNVRAVFTNLWDEFGI